MVSADDLESTKARNVLSLGPLDGFIGYMLRRAQVAVFDEFIREFEALELRPAQFSALLIISANPGLNQSEVAAALGVQRANFVAFVDRLEKRNLIERRASDKRSYALHLTRKGSELLERAITRQDELEARLEQRLGANGKRQLMQLLHKLA